MIRDISDTARWAAAFRARETERLDALFRDPFAAGLAGERGFEIATSLSEKSHDPSWVVRTYLFDKVIAREIEEGTDRVVNLGAGLDARPYRMAIPSSCEWIEIDHPEILAYKEAILSKETPSCSLERTPLDLSDRVARQALFSDIAHRAGKTLVITEGLLVYFSPEEVGALASDLAASLHCERWVLDMQSPGTLEAMTRKAGSQLESAGLRFQFGPVEGPQFFARFGWELMGAQGILKAAIKLNRTPIEPQVHEQISELPDAADGSFPWAGVCLFRRAG